MYPTLIHLGSGIGVHSYGLAIALGVIIFTYLLYRDKQCTKLIVHGQLLKTVQIGLIAGIIGGRIVTVLSEWSLFEHWTEWFMLSQGGFSLLGSIVAIITTLIFYLHLKRVAPLPVLDRMALYAPILQAVSRIGCFLAGCCSGKATSLPWAIIYRNPDCMAPIGIALHPTQLYSTILLLFIFLLLFYCIEKKCIHPGQLLCWYLLLACAERFGIDFFRVDQQFFNYTWFIRLSLHQWFALGIFMIASCYLMTRSLFPQRVAQT